ncbi:MMPL family transporter [Pseudoalteromonas sp. OOF1S-7]|uniref:efflux RND transporter permease subunit n=1 Tax=Pseudoalteromonas sp. OOF1S-7 TaxID=2917757 RepID=UPI001EF7090B|nr:MMPL family transporter [Pseudoalteromonas sp. OOF1S-7]
MSDPIQSSEIDSIQTSKQFSILSMRWWIIVLSIIITLGTGYGLERLQFSSDYRDFFAEDNVKLQAFESLQDKFVRSNNVFIAITTPNNTIYDKAGLDLIADISAKMRTLSHVLRVDSVTNYQFIRAQGDDILVSDYVQDLEQDLVTPQYLNDFYARAQAEKGLKDFLVGPERSVTGINLSLADDVTTETGKAAFMKALTELLSVYDEQTLQYHLTGSIVIDHGFDVSAQSDVETLYGLVYLTVLLLTWLLTRSIAATVAVLLSVTMSWFIALGIAGLSGLKLTAISVSAPTVLMTLAVAQSMHILFSVQKRIATGMYQKDAIEQAVRANIWPLFLVTLSTCAGFAAIMSSEVPPLQDLGFMLVVGNVAVFALSVTFLPAFLSLFKLKQVSHAERSEKRLGKLGLHIANRSGRYFVSGLLLSVALVFPITYNELNDNFIEYFDSENKVRVDAEYIDQRLTGVHQVYFEVQSPGKSEIFTPAYLTYIDDFTHWLNDQEIVRHVTSVADVQKKLYQASLGGASQDYRLPENKETATQMHLLYEMSLPYGLSTKNLVDLSRESTRVTVVVDNVSSKEILALEAKAAQWHKSYNSDIKLHPGTGPTIMFADIGQSNAHSLISSTVLAFVFVSIILLIALKSLKMSVLSLLPNLLPAVIAFGIWGLIDGEVGLAVSIVVVMTFGIVVDDTIYFLTHIKKNLNAATFNEVIAKTYQQVGSPIINTTIILVCGFAILAFSSFRLNQGMGMLTAMVIFIALIADLFMLPELIKRFIYKKER